LRELQLKIGGSYAKNKMFKMNMSIEIGLDRSACLGIL